MATVRTSSSSRSLLKDPAGLAGLAGLAVALISALLLVQLYLGQVWTWPPGGGYRAADFATFWGGGRMVMEGHAGAAYDWPHLRVWLEHAFAGPTRNELPFYYPPPYLLILEPLGLAPYHVAFLAWVTTGLVLYLAAAAVVLPRTSAVLAALGAPGLLACLLLGQNGVFTASVAAIGLGLLERRPRLAGVVLGLLCCKPHIALLVPFALAVDRRWAALAAMAASAAGLVVSTGLLLGGGVYRDFLQASAVARAGFAGSGWAEWFEVETLYGALRWAGAASAPAMVAHALWALAWSGAVLALWRSRAPFDLKAAALAAGALLVTPYAFFYDWVWLGIASLFVLRDVETRRGLATGEAVAFAAALAVATFGYYVRRSAPAPLLGAAGILGVVLWRAAEAARDASAPVAAPESAVGPAAQATSA